MSEVGLEGEVILDYHVSTNSRGLRGRREDAAPRPPGARRIVALGDSFTWGQSVEEEETFPARLEARGVEVPDLGVIGYGPGQMLLRLRRDGLPLEPDVGRAHGFLVVDARPAFDARPDKASLFIIDGHPDAAGHALIADEIARRAPWLLEATPGR
ncbi:MAG: hypothetical protein KIT58_03500 [Planctomycetota bacterium]|nr:hypothetical protein [Planctomycetota bacterium]